MKVPTTEELIDLEKEIQRLVERKRRTDLHIIDLEARIHAVETSFLRETAHFGAVMNGLEGYLSAVSGTGALGGISNGRKAREQIRDADRLLSGTSASQSRALAVHSRLVREGFLNPIAVGSSGGGAADKKSSFQSVSGTSGTRRHDQRQRKRHRPAPNNDPAWSTPRRSRH